MNRSVPATAALVLGLVAGCTTSGTPNTNVHSLPPQASGPTPNPLSLPPTGDASSLPSTPATTGTSQPPTSSAPPNAPHSTCTSVSIRVIRGSAIAGQEIAALQFTNTGSRSCVLEGYPTVTLLRNGSQLGQTSLPSTPELASSRTLAPGDVAESQLHDFTSCQAPLSDSIKVVAPGSTISTIRPQFQMRGCVLRVDRLGPPE